MKFLIKILFCVYNETSPSKYRDGCILHAQRGTYFWVLPFDMILATKQKKICLVKMIIWFWKKLSNLFLISRIYCDWMWLLLTYHYLIHELGKTTSSISTTKFICITLKITTHITQNTRGHTKQRKHIKIRHSLQCLWVQVSRSAVLGNGGQYPKKVLGRMPS